MQVSKIDGNEYQVDGAPIRGFDWQLIRTAHGTYARVAGPTGDDPDEEIVIEEWSDPERRERWNSMTVTAAASAARRIVLEDIGDGYAENAADIARACGKTANWVRILGPELEREGLAQKAGTSWLFSTKAADYIANRPDGRGRPGKIRFVIYSAGPEYRYALNREAKIACQTAYGDPVGEVAVDNWGEVPDMWNGLHLREAVVHYRDADGNDVKPFVAE